MRRTLLLVLVALLAPAAAQAHRTTSRMHSIRHIAVQLHGPFVCGNTMAVPITRGPMLQPQWLAYARRDDSGPPFTGCRIVVKDRRWATEYLCRVLVHEYTHLAGYRAPPGEEYIGPDGIPDYHHNRDPLSIMSPFELGYFAPCADGAADALPARRR